MKNKIELIARALILWKKRILLCRTIGDRHYFLPGGRVEFGESAQGALSRELKEELGIKSDYNPPSSLPPAVGPSIGSLIGTCEQIYREKGKKHHEINLVFKTKVGEIDLKSKERKLKFYLKDLKEFKKIYFLPRNLKEALMKYFKNKKLFWQTLDQ